MAVENDASADQTGGPEPVEALLAALLRLPAAEVARVRAATGSRRPRPRRGLVGPTADYGEPD